MPSHNLRDAGLKATLPRLRILELFEKNTARHLEVEEVYRLLLAEGLDIGLATVYRVLTQLEQAGFLTRRIFKAGRAAFEINAGLHHDHLICMDCGRVEEFCDAEIELRQKTIAAERGFRIEDHSLFLYVHCQREDCPNRQITGSDA
jgi:Fur family ferric uptake transcriptional regulator